MLLKFRALKEKREADLAAAAKNEGADLSLRRRYKAIQRATLGRRKEAL